MKKLMLVSATSILAASVSWFALTRSATGNHPSGVPLGLEEMRTTVGGQGAKYQCSQSTACPFADCPGDGFFNSDDSYYTCKYTGNSADSCQNNATYWCNLAHYRYAQCSTYWHTDLSQKSRCVSS